MIEVGIKIVKRNADDLTLPVRVVAIAPDIIDLTRHRWFPSERCYLRARRKYSRCGCVTCKSTNHRKNLIWGWDQLLTLRAANVVY